MMDMGIKYYVVTRGEYEDHEISFDYDDVRRRVEIIDSI